MHKHLEKSKTRRVSVGIINFLKTNKEKSFRGPKKTKTYTQVSGGQGSDLFSDRPCDEAVPDMTTDLVIADEDTMLDNWLRFIDEKDRKRKHDDKEEKGTGEALSSPHEDLATELTEAPPEKRSKPNQTKDRPHQELSEATGYSTTCTLSCLFSFFFFFNSKITA